MMHKVSGFFLFALLSWCSISPAQSAQKATSIIVDKTARTLILMNHGKVLRRYTQIKLGLNNPKGHKQQEGDLRTPEGQYRINGRNAQSQYHLSLRISYPNAKDIVTAKKLGVSPGGDIFIHGQPNGSTVERIPMDWTAGCISVSNAEIEEIWSLVDVGTPILIKP
jgi:murein L,D-transpeptidase YafK